MYNACIINFYLTLSTQMLHSIGHKPIICSGVSVGSIDIVLKYVKLMSTILEGEKLPTHPQLNVHKFPNCERNGVDQGIHNVLVHTRSIPSMKIFDQKSGPVSNLQAKVSQVRKQSAIQQKHLVALQYGGLFDPVVGSKSLGVVSKKEPLLVVNREQKPVHVLHQYDRDASLQSYLFRKVCSFVLSLIVSLTPTTITECSTCIGWIRITWLKSGAVICIAATTSTHILRIGNCSKVSVYRLYSCIYTSCLILGFMLACS